MDSSRRELSETEAFTKLITIENQNSYLRNREQCRSLHWRTRLCLQPEGIV